MATSEEIRALFGNTEKTIYKFNGTLDELQNVVNTSYVTVRYLDVVYFTVAEDDYVPNDDRMETV